MEIFGAIREAWLVFLEVGVDLFDLSVYVQRLRYPGGFLQQGALKNLGESAEKRAVWSGGYAGSSLESQRDN